MLTLPVLLSAASASEIFMEQRPLEEVVPFSALIAVVRPARPEWVDEKLPIPGHPEAEPFGFRRQRLEVVRIVHDATGDTKVGAVLEVAPGGLGNYWSMHYEYAVNGVMESPIVDAYDSPVAGLDPAPETWVALMGPCSVAERELLCFTVDNAMEKVENIDRIERLLRKPGGTALQPTPSEAPAAPAHPPEPPPDDPKKTRKSKDRKRD